MSEQAVPEETQETPSAESQHEASIPKYRFDQVAARLRSLEEANQIKDQTIARLTQPVQGKQEPEEDDEVLQSLDSSQLKAVKKLIGKELEKGRQEIGGVIGVLGNKVEAQAFLLNHGKDKSKYLERIQELRNEHARRGLFLDHETAYKFIRLEELEAAATKAPEKKPASVAAPERKDDVPPPAQATQVNPKPQQERTIEEIEADLDEQIKATGKGI
jgi:hypothetical protein